MSRVYHNLFDSHMHSNNSRCAEHSLMYLAQRAEEMGLMGMAVTDHIESLGFEPGGYKTRIYQSAVDTAKASAAFRHRISLSFGVELGVFPGMYDFAEQALGLYPYDFVLGACHYSRQGEHFAEINYGALTEKERHTLMLEYFEDLTELVLWGGFDSIAHINYPVRHASLKDNPCLSLTPYKEQVDALLRLLVDKGKSLDMGACGLGGLLEDALLPTWVFERYRELGGELITIGSGAHQAESVGVGITQAMELLSGLGYEYFTFYRARKPITLRIV